MARPTRSAGPAAGEHRDTVIVTTLAPCWYCSGLVRQFGIPRVVIGESVNFAGGVDWLRESGVDVRRSRRLASASSCSAASSPATGESWHEDIGEAASAGTRSASRSPIKGSPVDPHPSGARSTDVSDLARQRSTDDRSRCAAGDAIAGSARPSPRRGGRPVRVPAGGSQCAAPAQEIPAAVQLHRDLVEPRPVGGERGLVAAVALLTVAQLVLLGHQPLDPVADRLVGHVATIPARLLGHDAAP